MGDDDRAIVEFRGVSKRFGTLEVLRKVDLRLERGKTTVILGASGIGKSVLLRHIIGLLKPDEGEVYIDGQRIDELGEKDLVPIRRRFGFLFQMGALFDSLSVGDNIAFPLIEHTEYSRSRIDEIVAEKLVMVDLVGVDGHKPVELSGGQRKRVALARALAMDPEVVLYDEPTTGLDPIRAAGINHLINKIRDQRGVTGVVVTHDMHSAFTVADRILMLYGGTFIEDGPVEAIRRSDDPRVQEFVSSTGMQT